MGSLPPPHKLPRFPTKHIIVIRTLEPFDLTVISDFVLFHGMTVAWICQQVKKNINNLPSTPVPENGRYVVHPFAREADPAPLIDLWKASFSNAAQSLCHVPGEQIQERFEAFIKDIRFDHPELETFIIRDQNDALSGFVRLKAVEHNGQKYAQINTIQITQEPEDAVGVLLKTIEQWALQRSISCIVTGKISEDNLLACFHQAGYTNSNLYMFKSLSERTK